MKNYILALAILLSLTTQSFGFATIVSSKIKGGDAIAFNANTSGIDVYLDGQKVGVIYGNAFTYSINRTGNPRVFSFKKEGYKDFSVTLNTQFDHIFWLNGLFGYSSTFGSSTDSWSTNSTREYTPNQFYIDMVKL